MVYMGERDTKKKFQLLYCHISKVGSSLLSPKYTLTLKFDKYYSHVNSSYTPE